MTFFCRIKAYWLRLLRRPGSEELDEEIRAHLQIAIDEYIDDGMSPDEARYAALRKFGNTLRCKEAVRETWQFNWLDSLFMDIRYALRSYRNSPVFALAVIGTLALGLGALSASYSVFNNVVLRPYSVRDPYSLYAFNGWESSAGGGKGTFTQQELLDLRRDNQAFSEILGYQNGTASVAGKRANLQAVTGNYFDMLGVPICLGRPFRESDDPMAENLAVASYDAWKSRLGSDPGIIGTKLQIGEKYTELVGVACPKFTGPQLQKIDFWVSLPLSSELMGDFGQRGPQFWWPITHQHLSIMGRLKPGLTKESAASALISYGRQKYRTWGDLAQPPDKANLTPAWTLFPHNRSTVAFFMPWFLAFGLLLLIACANVANMMLARGLARRREIAIRVSLGAGRGRMIRQLLTENLLLTVPAALAGFGVAYGMIRVLYWLFAKVVFPDFLFDYAKTDFNLPSCSPDLRVLAFLFVAALITTLLFGLLPAIQITRSDLTQANREGFESGQRVGRLRSGLVILQAMMCALLLILSGVAMRNGMRTASIDLGLDTQGVFWIETSGKVKVQTVLDRLSSIPATNAIGTCIWPQLQQQFFIDPAKFIGEKSDVSVTCVPTWVSPEYFDIYKIAVTGRKSPAGIMDSQLAGNPAKLSDGPRDGTEVVVSETAARLLWPSGYVLGKMLTENKLDRKAGTSSVSRFPVIGIAKDSVFELYNLPNIPDPRHQAVVYFLGPPTEKNIPFPTILVRMNGDPRTARHLLQKVLEETTPGETHFKISSAGEDWDIYLYPYRGLSVVSGFLGLIALLMTVSGIFAMLSYVIAQRKKEFGIRAALGAGKAHITGMVLRQSLKLATIGSALGAILALTAARVLASNFISFNESGYISGVFIVIATALIASWIPVRRALRLNPVETLRCD